MLQPRPEMSKRILVGNQINPEFTTARIQFQDFFPGNGSPRSPDRFVVRISKGVLSIELKLVGLEIGEMLHQFQQCLQSRNAPAGNIEHHTSTSEIAMVADLEAGEAPAEFTLKLPQRRNRGAQAILREI